LPGASKRDRKGHGRSGAGDSAPDAPPPGEEHVDKRAREIAEGGDEGHADVRDDPSAARRAAESTLEESEERTFDPATTDPEDEGVIRRNSDETAT
jgi:hypothetical protein